MRTERGRQDDVTAAFFSDFVKASGRAVSNLPAIRASSTGPVLAQQPAIVASRLQQLVLAKRSPDLSRPGRDHPDTLRPTIRTTDAPMSCRTGGFYDFDAAIGSVPTIPGPASLDLAARGRSSFQQFDVSHTTKPRGGAAGAVREHVAAGDQGKSATGKGMAGIHQPAGASQRQGPNGGVIFNRPMLPAVQ